MNSNMKLKAMECPACGGTGGALDDGSRDCRRCAGIGTVWAREFAPIRFNWGWFLGSMAAAGAVGVALICFFVR